MAQHLVALLPAQRLALAAQQAGDVVPVLLEQRLRGGPLPSSVIANTM